MIRPPILLLLATSISTSSLAQAVLTAPWMTGERLATMVRFAPGVRGNFDLSREQYLDAERARLYIEGVHDSSEGKQWCYSERHRPGPDLLRDQAEVGLRELSAEQLKDNAAELIIGIWKSKWPCPTMRAGQ